MTSRLATGKRLTFFYSERYPPPTPAPGKSGNVKVIDRQVSAIALGEDCCNKVRTFRSTNVSQFRGDILHIEDYALHNLLCADMIFFPFVQILKT